MSTADSPDVVESEVKTSPAVPLGYQTPLPLDQIASQRMTHYRWVILGLIFCGTTLNYLDRLVIAILFPEHLQQQYGITDAQWGYIGSAFGLAYAFGQFISGSLLDRIGTRMGYALALAAWSGCAALTALGRGALSFGIVRAMLGVAESPAFPAAARTCAEWFPQRQRAFAFGIVNAGTNMGAIAAPLLVPWLAMHWGWQSAFVVTGGLGLVMLALWLPLYRRPEEHPKISQAELALIQGDGPEAETAKIPTILDLRPFSFSGHINGATAAGTLTALSLLAIGVGPLISLLANRTYGTRLAWLGMSVLSAAVLVAAWIVGSTLKQWSNPSETRSVTNLIGYRHAWVFALGKFITDPMWWFYMTWLPKFLHDRYSLDLTHIGLPLVVIYVMSDAGSIVGGWLSSNMIHRGFSVNVSRKTTFLLAAACVLPIIVAQQVSHLWVAVLILGFATAGHQAFSSNLYTLCSDLFPKRAVASVAGFGGSFGWIGASLFQACVGLWVQSLHNYWGPFIAAGLAYFFALAVIHILSPRLDSATIDSQTEPRGFDVIISNPPT